MDLHIKTRLSKALADTSITVTELSKTLEINRSTLNKFLNGERVLGLEELLKVLDFLIPIYSERYNLLKAISLEYKTIQPLKTMLEIARLNRDPSFEKEIISIIRKASKQKDREWADFYEIFSNYREGKVDGEQFYSEVISFKTQSEELQAYRQYTIAFYYLVIEMNPVKAKLQLEKCKDAIFNLPETLLKKCFKYKWYDQMGTLVMKVGTPTEETLEEARNYFKKALEHSILDFTNYLTRYNIGTTYQYNQPMKFYEILNDALEFIKKHGITIPHEGFYRSVFLPLCLVQAEEYDRVEINSLHILPKALYYSQKGKIEELQNLIENADKEVSENSFIQYCLGSVKKDIPLLLKSFVQCIEEYDLLTARYPMNELLSMGFTQDMLESIIQLKFNQGRLQMFH
ncbi:helix-turn-helix transcriptional regulator [Bacillus luteolus]|uniref:Helix-turn-helix transcriptional regulator n=1 Tax=Litchfieldia luteola TaxID=682179 RepID=A0ABR9QFC4_9BACI|nr:AimR family lysis-lysogeny pheromone receptor [Cytobacillus luteolus]MBE4907193.1 helix-turn-helix transcriptional regulator [Cytobacillus luteolus]MBP1943335.1 DNA-binding Xre family transcriptional regulator [Cytobacillus luteolus]